MSIRRLVEKYPEIFSKEKYQSIIDQDAGDPGVSMDYYIDEIIGIEGYDYDDYLGKHKLTEEEERKCTISNGLKMSAAIFFKIK